MRSRTLIFLALALVALVLYGCSQEEPAPGVTVEGLPAVEQAATPTQVVPSATPTKAAVIVIEPSPTLPPTETVPSEPAATPTATAIRLLTAADFGETRNPLTGEEVADPAVLERRPIAVKISNYPPSYVRPQSGLNKADLVFEHITEGWIPRFTAVFYAETPEDVGPIRSARLIDLEIPAMYDAALAYSGASIGVSQRLIESDFRDRILRSSTPGYYRTGENKPYEHTLYGDPAQWWEALAEQGKNRAPELADYMAFSSDLPAGGEPATEITIRYREQEEVEWRYEPENGRYWRQSDGEVHVDENSGEQLNSTNVVVVFANHPINYSICENLQNDACLAFSTEIQIWGEGPALIFRDGQRYEATWHRQEREDLLTFTDAAGEPLPLAIGRTWFQMVPGDAMSAVTATP